MIGSTSLLLFSFIYSLYKDPFTDEITHVAQFGRDDGPALSVECGAMTNWQLAVRIVPGFDLYSNRRGIPGVYEDQIRFDDDQPIKMKISYQGDVAFITGGSAKSFSNRLMTASLVQLEMTDFYYNTKIIRLTDIGLKDAVSKVRSECLSHNVK